MKSNKVVIYTRTCQDKPEQENNSISHQINLCLEYIRKNNLDVVKVYADRGQSGSNFDRPFFQQMLNFCKSSDDISGIVVSHPDRFFRNAQVGLMIEKYLEKRGTRLLFDGCDENTPSSNFVNSILFAVSNLENAVLGK